MKTRANFLGGLEKYTHFLMRAFAQQGCQVTLLTTGIPCSIEGITTISLAPHSKFTLYHLTHFDHLCRQWLKQHPQDIIFGMERTTVQTHYRVGNGVHAIFLKRRKMLDPHWKQWTFLINPLHHTLLKMEQRAFESSALKLLFTNSEMVRNEILTLYNTPSKRVEVIHNGVEWKKLHVPFEASLSKREGPYHFLFIGNGYRRKGLHFLLQGLEQLKKRNFKLTVIGKDKNPEFFIRLAQEMGLIDKIQFLGPQSEIIPYYQAADALVLPSIYDPFANVTIEALAMGLFVVTSRFNGGQEVIQEGSGAIIEELTSPESVATCLEKAFDNPKIENRARNIRQSVKELDFSIQLDKIVRKTLTT